jgi:hypothetical protein
MGTRLALVSGLLQIRQGAAKITEEIASSARFRSIAT